MSEIYKDVLEYEGLYKVCDDGSIIGPKGWKLKPGIDKVTGYYHVILCKDGKRKGKYVHRLVWEAFRGPIPPGMEINHIDEDKSNNALNNLELVTHKQNMNHGTQSERANMTKRHNGTLGLNAKRVAQVGPDFKLIKIHSSLKNASDSTGAFMSNISMCCRCKDKTAKGFHWVIIPPDCQDVESFIRNHFK